MILPPSHTCTPRGKKKEERTRKNLPTFTSFRPPKVKEKKEGGPVASIAPHESGQQPGERGEKEGGGESVPLMKPNLLYLPPCLASLLKPVDHRTKLKRGEGKRGSVRWHGKGRKGKTYDEGHFLSRLLAAVGAT